MIEVYKHKCMICGETVGRVLDDAPGIAVVGEKTDCICGNCRDAVLFVRNNKDLLNMAAVAKVPERAKESGWL